MADGSATHEKVSVLGEDNPAVRRIGPDRMAAMELLAGARREEVARESGVAIEAPDPDNPPDDDTSAETAKREREEAAAREASRNNAETAADRDSREARDRDEQLRKQVLSDDRVVLEGDLSKYAVRVKVDGIEQDVPLDRAHRILQKDYAADRRLEEATRRSKSAEALEREATEKLAAANAELTRARSSGDRTEIRKAETRADKAATTADDVRQKITAAAEALFAGDTVAAADTFTELFAERRAEQPATPDPDALADAVEARVNQRVALSRFRKDYPDICTNPVLTAMCDAKVRELHAGGLAFEDALEDSATFVHDEIKKMAAGIGMTEAKTGSTGRRVDRERKERIDEPSTARSAQASTTREAEPTGASSVIAEMAAQRRPTVREKPPPA